jgi:hypothetical protein
MPLSRITLSPTGHLCRLTVSGSLEAVMVSWPGWQASYVRCLLVCADDAPVTMTTVRTASVKAVTSRIDLRPCHLPTDTTVTYRVRGYGDYPYIVRSSAQPLQMSCFTIMLTSRHITSRGWEILRAQTN